MADIQLEDQGVSVRTAYDEYAITVNDQTGLTYELALVDTQVPVTMTNAAANTVTIPANSSTPFPIGAVIVVIMLGAGTTTIEGATGVTLTGNGGSVSAGSCDIQTQYASASLIKIATDQWHVAGDITTVA